MSPVQRDASADTQKQLLKTKATLYLEVMSEMTVIQHL